MPERDIEPPFISEGTRWVLPDGRRVRVQRRHPWITDDPVTVWVENRRKGGRRETTFTEATFRRIARTLEVESD